MEFRKKYISFNEKKEKPDDKRVELSDETFAIMEMLDEISFRLRREK